MSATSNAYAGYSCSNSAVSSRCNNNIIGLRPNNSHQARTTTPVPPSAYHVQGQPTLHDLQIVMPHLSTEQHSRVLVAFNNNVESSSSPQAHAVFSDDFAKGLGFEGDGWCG
ncbi:uncharacterized protein LOC126627426 [Malus sylvestris]|uniref:uncharacterized protein LOC126627426 n=1 Tax=Malus sylvestris TaxID=3752 RepID=UPI0021AC57EB|nr:uncharacterized protein LOC126627426 [Malus sylvestris]